LKPGLKAAFKRISWLNGLFLESDEPGFLKKEVKDVSNVTKFASQLANVYLFSHL
jgi:hypothetical protein